MNRTIMERARSMRLHAGLPLTFWAEAISTIVYLINRSPSTVLDGNLPEEAWTSKKVNYSFLKVFGCEAFMHIDKSLRSKLESKSRKSSLAMEKGILGIVYGILKIVKSLEVEMSFSMKIVCSRITCMKNKQAMQVISTWSLRTMNTPKGVKICKNNKMKNLNLQSGEQQE